MKKTAFIVNPNAANGACGKGWPALEALARDYVAQFRTYMTVAPGTAETLVGRAVADGAGTVVCVGGDGTFNEVINGLMGLPDDVRAGLAVGFIPVGTGCDFVRTAGIPKKPAQALALITSGHLRAIDIGRLGYLDNENRHQSRYFHNITSFGLGGEVDARVNRSTKIFGPFLSFIWATIISVLTYGSKQICLTIDDTIRVETKVWNVAVANGRYHGGGMQIAPDALLEDARFHITVVGDLSLAEVFLNLRHLYDGRIYGVKKIFSYQGEKVEATSTEEVLLDVDGEQPGHLPVVIDLIPQAVNLFLPPA